MNLKKMPFLLIILLLCIFLGIVNAQTLTPIEQLGKSIFIDINLSLNKNQSCASCHASEAGWTGPDEYINAQGAVYEGSIPGYFGNRKPPSSAYTTFSPIFHFVIDKKRNVFIGGNFWDGRATGEKLGNPAADQAQGPFLNPLEQALPSPDEVVERVCSSSYQDLFKQVWSYYGNICDSSKTATAYDAIALSIAAYEASPEVNAFTSKYDYYKAGWVDLTEQEKKGLNLFKLKGKCSKCHTIDSGSKSDPPLFTNFTYDNLGIPRNMENPFYRQTDFNPKGYFWIDLGLGGFLNSRLDYNKFALANKGKHKVPTLRNVDKRPYEGFIKAYGHNGYFKSLKGFVHFLNTRHTKRVCLNSFLTETEALAHNCWPLPEVLLNLNIKEIGKLNLKGDEEDALVEFLRTLTDGFTLP